MINFYHDAVLKTANSQNNPKRFLRPLKGSTGRPSVIYLADNYYASAVVAGANGTSIVSLDKTDEFLNAGTAVVYSNGVQTQFTYTAKTISTLTGVTGFPGCLIGDKVKPHKIYKSVGNITVGPRGVDLSQVIVSVGAASNTLGFTNSLVILPRLQYDSIADAPIPIYLNVGVVPGIQEDFTNFSIATNPLYIRDAGDSSAISATEIGVTVNLFSSLFRRDEFQVASLRLLPSSRAISSVNPGFVIGSYRWRGPDNINSQILIPTDWSVDSTSIPRSNFISGYASGDDLAPIDLENQVNSIYLRINEGFYFDGPDRYYLPSSPQILFVNGAQAGAYLTPKPNNGEPILVCAWLLDSNKFYQKYVDYRYQASGQFDTSSTAPVYQYIYDRVTGLITVNQVLNPNVYFLGTITGESTDYFDLPIHPVDSVQELYVDRGLGIARVYSNNYSFSQSDSTVVISSPTGTGNSIPGTNIGEPVYALLNPAYAVIYNSSQDSTRLLTEVDINPAFAGISSGYIYLQHTRKKPAVITVSVDKPIIDIPATFSSVIDLIAYGPIYYNGDYALLTLTALGPINNEPVPNAQLVVLPGPNFSGTINYQDPTANQIIVRTGADGKANLLYVPDSNFGYYIPNAASVNGNGGLAETNNANDTVVLPVPLPINEVYNASEGWFVKLYNISNTDPLFGMANANVALGQIPYVESGTPGTTSYQTNGEKIVWAINGVPVTPINAFDANGNSYNSQNFNGQVTRLVYATSLNSAPDYFITFIQRVSLQVQYLHSNIYSNTILLQMALADTINQDPWLVLDDSIQGILEQYRLGWQQDLPNSL